MEAYKSNKVIGSIIPSGFYEKLVLIGFPFDEGAKSSGLRVGAAYGPDCFRRFLNKIGPINNAEYDSDLSKITMCDYGNISAINMQARYSKLTNKIRLTMGRGQITFVIGGTRDLVPFCVKGITEYPPKLEMPITKGKSDSTTHQELSPDELKSHKILIIGICPNIDTDDHEISSSSKYIWRKVLEDPEFEKSGSRIILFGINSFCDKSNYDYFNSKGGSVIWLNSFRKTKVEATPFVQTQAGKAFEDLINSKCGEYEHVYISFSLESIVVIIYKIIGNIRSY